MLYHPSLAWQQVYSDLVGVELIKFISVVPSIFGMAAGLPRLVWDCQCLCVKRCVDAFDVVPDHAPSLHRSQMCCAPNSFMCCMFHHVSLQQFI